MKVLQINSVCGIGSTGRIATDIHNILIQQGHKSYIAYGRDLPKNCDTAIKIGTKYDNYRHVALTRIYDKHGFGSKRATKEFINKVEEINPDVIHLHNIHGYYINIKLLFDYLKKANKPVVWTLHDCWAFTGHCSHFDYAGCNRWKSECHSCPEKKSYPSSKLFDNSRRNFLDKKDTFTGMKNLIIVTPSKWLASKVKESFLNEYPVHVINNGVNLNIFKPQVSNFKSKYDINDKFVILGVSGIWGERKGFHYFLELSEQLYEDEIIVLVGVTEKQKANLPRNIIGVTKTHDVHELVEIYSAADIFVNPTLEDNFPTTNIESLACGTPIITFNTGGSVESVDESCGFIVDKGNIKELLNKVRLLKLSGKALYSRNALAKARKLYRDEDRFKDYIDIYNELSLNVH